MIRWTLLCRCGTFCHFLSPIQAAKLRSVHRHARVIPSAYYENWLTEAYADAAELTGATL